MAGANAKGSWTELIASTSIAAKLVWVHYRANTDASPYVLDIGVGSAGSEDVIIPNLLVDQQTAGTGNAQGGFGPFRVDIASASRIAVRAETDATAAGDETINVEVLICDSELPLLTSPTLNTYGVTVGSTPKGNTLDPGATINTKGAYTEITASAAASIQHLHIVLGTKMNTAAAAADFLIDIAIGSAGSETDIVSNLFFSTIAAPDFILPTTIVIPGDNFGSQRISARAQCSINDATDRLLSIAATAVSGTVPSAGSGGAATLVNSQALVG